MKKLKTFLMSGLVAGLVGVGALASVPSASAMPNTLCNHYLIQARASHDLYLIFYGLGDWRRAEGYLNQWNAFEDAYTSCVLYG